MNIKEALVSTVGIPVNDDIIDKVLLDNDLVGTTNYRKADSAKIEMAVIDVLLAIWITPDITEGGYSVKQNSAALKSRLLLLAAKYDRTDVTGTLNPKREVREVRKW
ncbi:DUF6706 family protein [Flavitalea antarctica]